MSGQEFVLAKKRGRPATGRGQTIGVRVHAPLLSALDDWIEQQPDPKPTRPEAIRQIVTDWLEAKG
jgi:hypothetical protein